MRLIVRARASLNRRKAAADQGLTALHTAARNVADKKVEDAEALATLLKNEEQQLRAEEDAEATDMQAYIKSEREATSKRATKFDDALLDAKDPNIEGKAEFEEIKVGFCK